MQIHVRDFLSRYDADALRYFLTIAGPETQDTDFTWSEFVRRNNDELVATWGNLVNRTLQSAYKNFGVVPSPGSSTAEDEALLREVEQGFESVGALIEATRFKAALQEAMRLAGSATSTWPRRRRGRCSRPTVSAPARSCTSRCAWSIASRRVHALPSVLGAAAARSARLRRRHRRPARVRDHRRGGRRACGPHRRVHEWSGSWEPSRLPPGQRLPEPRPLFVKLDAEHVVDEELARMEAAAA